MKCPLCKKEIICKLSIHRDIQDFPAKKIYQWWSCKSCDEKFFAIYEEDFVNIFADSYEHIGWHANKENWEKSLKFASKCSNPKNTNCKCKVHESMPPDEFIGEKVWYSCR